jgi:hypothetical protein
VLREHPRRLAGQGEQKVELAGREVHAPPVDLHPARHRIDDQIEDSDRSARRPPLGPSQHRVHPREQLGIAERLDHVVVRTAAEAAHALVLASAPGQHDHRQVVVDGTGRRLRAAHVVEHLQPARLAEPDVEQRHVGTAGLDRAARLPHRPGDRHGEPVGAQVVGEESRRRRVVLDHQHLLRVHACVRPEPAELAPL